MPKKGVFHVCRGNEETQRGTYKREWRECKESKLSRKYNGRATGDVFIT